MIVTGKNIYRLIFLVLLPLLFFNCGGTSSSSDTLYIKEFKWQLKMPEFLLSENKSEWKRVQESGRAAIGETYHTELKNKLKTIFIFKTADQSFFEAVSEPITQKQIENYDQVCEQMNNAFYNTIKTQVPAAKIDTIKGIEVIDNLSFNFLKAKLTFPDGSSKATASYRRVFSDTELTVSIMYSNELSGEEILKAFKSSKFGKDQ